MANTRRGGSGGSLPAGGEPPAQVANVTPPSTPMMDHSFTLQAIMDLKGSVSTLMVKVDRLIVDVSKQGEKLDRVQHQISFVRGALWVIGGLFAIAIAAIGIYARIKGAL